MTTIVHHKFIIVPPPRARYNIAPPRQGFIKSWTEEVYCDSEEIEEQLREASRQEFVRAANEARTWLSKPLEEIPWDHPLEGT